jgi:hypothetical protein
MNDQRWGWTWSGFDILFLYHDKPSCVSSTALQWQSILPTSWIMEQLLTCDWSRYVVDRVQYTAVVSHRIRYHEYIRSRTFIVSLSHSQDFLQFKVRCTDVAWHSMILPCWCGLLQREEGLKISTAQLWLLSGWDRLTGFAQDKELPSTEMAHRQSGVYKEEPGVAVAGDHVRVQLSHQFL